jgi:hypothetical protein
MRAVNCRFIEGVNFEIRLEEDEERDFTRFKFLTEEDLGNRIEDHKEFLRTPLEEEKEDEPYWKSENIDKSPGEYDEFKQVKRFDIDIEVSLLSLSAGPSHSGLNECSRSELSV